MGSRPERVNGHKGTETRPLLLREAAVGKPAAAVIRMSQALSGFIGRKARLGGYVSLM